MQMSVLDAFNIISDHELPWAAAGDGANVNSLASGAPTYFRFCVKERLCRLNAIFAVVLMANLLQQRHKIFY